MLLAEGTTATVPRLQAECQQLLSLRPATPQPPHLCPSLGIPQTGPAFQRRSWNSGDASSGGRPEPAGTAWSLERPRGLGKERKGPLGPAVGSWRTQGLTCIPRKDDLSGEEAGPQWAALPASVPLSGSVTPNVPGTGWMLGPFRERPSQTQEDKKGVH